MNYTDGIFQEFRRNGRTIVSSFKENNDILEIYTFINYHSRVQVK